MDTETQTDVSYEYDEDNDDIYKILTKEQLIKDLDMIDLENEVISKENNRLKKKVNRLIKANKYLKGKTLHKTKQV